MSLAGINLFQCGNCRCRLAYNGLIVVLWRGVGRCVDWLWVLWLDTLWAADMIYSSLGSTKR